MGDIKACNHRILKLSDNFSKLEEAQRHQGLRIYLKPTLEEAWAYVNSNTPLHVLCDFHHPQNGNQTVLNIKWGAEEEMTQNYPQVL